MNLHLPKPTPCFSLFQYPTDLIYMSIYLSPEDSWRSPLSFLSFCFLKQGLMYPNWLWIHSVAEVVLELPEIYLSLPLYWDYGSAAPCSVFFPCILDTDVKWAAWVAAVPTVPVQYWHHWARSSLGCEWIVGKVPFHRLLPSVLRSRVPQAFLPRNLLSALLPRPALISWPVTLERELWLH